jgi:hypothetical protein
VSLPSASMLSWAHEAIRRWRTDRFSFLPLLLGDLYPPAAPQSRVPQMILRPPLGKLKLPFNQQHSFIFAAVSPCPAPPLFVSGRFANGQSAVFS